MKKAVILCSGGLDSATVMAIAKDKGFDLIAISFDYGQRHSVELKAAKKVAQHFNAKHIVLNADLAKIGGSALTENISVPKGRNQDQMSKNIPITYVPARNTIFLSYALAVAEVAGAREIFIGANAVDYSGYPDCRPNFIQAFEKMANLATKAADTGEKYIISAPLMLLSKKKIIEMGISLGLDYSITHSCYSPTEDLACGECDSCILRKKGFEEAGVADPTRYKKGTVKEPKQ